MEKWTDISGKTMKIWENAFNGRLYYSTTLGSKKEDGTYENMKINVQIPKDTVIHNGDDIIVNKGFITFYKDHNGLAHIKIVILELSVANTTPA